MKKMIKLSQILQQKSYIKTLQEYDRCFLKNIIDKYFDNLFFIGDTSICKTHIVVSLVNWRYM